MSHVQPTTKRFCPECSAFEGHYMHCSENPLTFRDEEPLPANQGQANAGARPETLQGGDQTGENKEAHDTPREQAVGGTKNVGHRWHEPEMNLSSVSPTDGGDRPHRASADSPSAQLREIAEKLYCELGICEAQAQNRRKSGIAVILRALEEACQLGIKSAIITHYLFKAGQEKQLRETEIKLNNLEQGYGRH